MICHIPIVVRKNMCLVVSFCPFVIVLHVMKNIPIKPPTVVYTRTDIRFLRIGRVCPVLKCHLLRCFHLRKSGGRLPPQSRVWRPTIYRFSPNGLMRQSFLPFWGKHRERGFAPRYPRDYGSRSLRRIDLCMMCSILNLSVS